MLGSRQFFWYGRGMVLSGLPLLFTSLSLLHSSNNDNKDFDLVVWTLNTCYVRRFVYRSVFIVLALSQLLVG